MRWRWSELELALVPFIVLAAMPFAVALAKRGWISQWLIVANMLIFGYMWVLEFASPAAWLALDNQVVFNSSRPLDVGLLASMFVHADILHLLGNMLVLYFIGVSLEERIGTRRTMAIYVLTGLLATVGYALLRWGQDFRLVGASGAVSGLMGAILVLYPRDEIPMIVGPIFLRRVPVWIAVGVFFGMEVLLTMMMVANGQSDNVAHSAHVVGLVAGICLAPLFVRVGAKPSGKKGLEADKKVLDTLRRLAPTSEARDAVDAAAREEIDDVRGAWLERALDLTRCPRCGGALQRSGGGLACKGCKAKF
ncbi:MAG: rhomboid family intramembrane serine protease [Methanobacteriota archaeon]